MSINISETIWMIINFFLLLFLLKRFLYNPITKFMDERNERIRSAMNAEKEALDEEQRLHEELESRLGDSREEAKRIIDEQKSADMKRRAETLAKAREDAAASRLELSDRVMEEHRASESRLEEKCGEYAGILAARLLGHGAEK